MVTPNKRLNSGPLADYLAVRQLAHSGAAHYMYEASGWVGGWVSGWVGGRARAAHYMYEASEGN